MIRQEESRSISENVTWGQRKRFADGKVNLPYGQFLGYEKGENGLPKIVEKEAQVIRRIYRMFLEGKTPAGIAKKLTDEGILTPAGKKKWQTSTVLSILQNEKYKGDARLQKSFTVDFLTKKKKVNEGEIPQYYVENSHPAIVSPEIYDLVQIEIDKRKYVKGYKTGASCFSGKIVCGECGSFYGSKVWHSTSIYRRTIWQCNHKFTNEKKCQTPHIYEDNLKKAFIEVFNNLLNNKEEVLKNYEAIIKAVTDTSKLDREKAEILEESEDISNKIRDYVEANSYTTINQEEYNTNYNTMKVQYEKIKFKLEEISNKYTELNARQVSIKEFISTINKNNELLTGFDDELWNAIIEKVTVMYEEQLEFIFKNGNKIIWDK